MTPYLPMDGASPVKEFHDTFCRVAGHDASDARYRDACEEIWLELQGQGYTPGEVALVVEYVKRRNATASEPGFQRKITPSSITGAWKRGRKKLTLDLWRFVEDLQEAKRIKALKDKQRDPRQSVLNAFRGTPPVGVVEDSVIPIRDVLKNIIKLGVK